jgi:putative transposase
VNVDPFIEAERAQQHNVTRVCQLLKVSRAAYYTRRAGSASAHQQVDKQLTEHIRAAHTASKGRYGAPASTPSCAAPATGTAASASPG